MKKTLIIVVSVLIVLGICLVAVLNFRPKSLIGSWHASPSVSAGYLERFVFQSSSAYIYYPSEESGSDSITGKWSVVGKVLILFEKGNLLPTVMNIGEVETETDKAIVYDKKIKIGENTYWRYTEETNLWNVKGDLIIE